VKRGLIFLLICGTACSSQNPPQSLNNANPEGKASPQAYFELGQQFRQQGDGNRAEEYLRLAIDLGYPKEPGLAALLRVCLETGRLRMALDYAERQLKANPSDNSLRQLVATLHMGLGNSSQAIDELEDVVSRSPETATPHYLLGIVYETAFADYGSAATHFRSYLRLDPQGPYAAETTDRLRARAFEKLPRQSVTHQ
jgi:tetratricopeptide (TPR) repeat protein